MRRLPASSGCASSGHSKATWAAGGDCVVPTANGEGGGIVLVAEDFVGAREGRMVAMWAENLATLNCNMTRSSRRQRSNRWGNSSGSHCRSAGRHVWRWGADNVLCAMMAGAAGGEAANPLLVAENKVCFKHCKRPFGEGRRQKCSVLVVAKRPVFSIITNVRVMMG